MLLNEFELTLDYQNDEKVINNLMIDNNLSYNEASILYYNWNWKEKCRNFNLETRCMTSMYSRLFPKFITKNEWKILIQCCDKVFDDRIISCGGVISTQVKINYTNYCRLTNNEKKRYALETLMKGIKKIINYRNWNIEPFMVTSNQIISLNYDNTWIWKTVKSNTLEAKVICQHSVNDITIVLVVSDLHENIILNDKIITELPDEWAYSKYLGNLKIEKNKILLLDKKKKIFKSYSV